MILEQQRLPVNSSDWDDETPTGVDLNAARPMRDLVYGNAAQPDAVRS